MRLLGSARYFRSHLSHMKYCCIINSHHRLYRTSTSFIRTDVKEKERKRERERERERKREEKYATEKTKLFLRLLRLRKTEIIMTLSDLLYLFSPSSPFAREERDERKMARSRVPYYKYAKRTRVESFVSNFSSDRNLKEVL